MSTGVVDGISSYFPGRLVWRCPGDAKTTRPDLVPAESGSDPGVMERGASLDRQSLPGDSAIGPRGNDTSHVSGVHDEQVQGLEMVGCVEVEMH